MLLALLGTVALAAPGRVVDPFEEADESELFRLDEQIVTVASRYAQTVRHAPSIVTLVTADDIRRRGYRTVSDALRDILGIYVWKSPEGRDLAAFRGIVAPDNDKILLLVDGAPWYDGVYTHAWIDNYLPIAHVKQIEVIKGPGSAIYGTNAFAGVINVVTRTAADVDGARVRATGGGNGAIDVLGMVGGVEHIGDRAAHAVAWVRRYSQRGDGLDVGPDGSFDVLGEDPKEGLVVGGRFDLDGLHVEGHHVDYRHSYLVQGAEQPYGLLAEDIDTNGLTYHDTFFRTRLALRLGRDVTVTPAVWAQHHDDPGSYWYVSGFSTSDTDGDGVLDTTQHTTLVETEKRTRRWGAGVDGDARLGINHHAVLGAGTETTVVLGIWDRAWADLSGDPEFTGFGVLTDPSDPDSFVPAPGEPRRKLCNGYLYAQDTWTVAPGVEITGGARLDNRFACHPADDADAAAFQPNLSPRLGVLLVPTDRVTVKLLHGWAFRYPTVREVLVSAELDDDGTYPWARGSYRLAPEAIRTTEAEVTANLGGAELRADVFHSAVTDEIDKVSPPNQYENLAGTLNVVGGELEGRATAGPATIRLGYAYTNARYAAGTSNPYAGRPQYEFPPHMAKGGLEWRVTPRATATWLAEAYGERPRRAWSPTARIDDGAPFVLVHGAMRVAELGRDGRASVDLGVRNVLGTAWSTGVYRDEADATDDGAAEYPSGIAGERRTVWVGVEFAI